MQVFTDTTRPSTLYAEKFPEKDITFTSIFSVITFLSLFTTLPSYLAYVLRSRALPAVVLLNLLAIVFPPIWFVALLLSFFFKYDESKFAMLQLMEMQLENKVNNIK